VLTPSLAILLEFNRLARLHADPDGEFSLNWCEKRQAWGILKYDFYMGSSWFSFMTFDRKSGIDT